MAEAATISEAPIARRPPLQDFSLNAHIHPMELVKAYAGHVIDKQGREIIDLYCCGGANLLGHGYRPVTRAVRRQARKFSSPGLPHPEFWELMRVLIELIPGAERVRYGKNGSDVTMGAVRLARAITNRERVVHHGYHGFHDWWMASTPCKGIPQSLRPLIITLPELTAEAVDEILCDNAGEVACLILDPMVPPFAKAETIREIIDVVHRHGALVIFDEMVSGFRVAPGGAQEVWGLAPDLCCFGKSIANGMPLSVLAGREEHMNRIGEINYGMTFEGEAVSIAAALATLDEIRRRNVCGDLAAKGKMLRESYAAAARNSGLNTALIGADARLYLWIDDHGPLAARELRWLCIQELARAGILTQGSFTLCYSHTPRDLKKIVAAFSSALQVIKSAVTQGSVRGLLDERLRAEL